MKKNVSIVLKTHFLSFPVLLIGFIYYIYVKSIDASAFERVLALLLPIALFIFLHGVMVYFTKTYISQRLFGWGKVVEGQEARVAGKILMIFGILLFLGSLVVAYVFFR